MTLLTIMQFCARPKFWLPILTVFFAVTVIWAAVKDTPNPSADTGIPLALAAKSALSVEVITPKVEDWPQTLAANGNIVPWEEVVIGAEISNFRLTEVLVSVGDTVKKGQRLAHISSDTVGAEFAQAKAAVAEAKASLAEATADAERARQMEASNFLSSQQITQYLAAEQTAVARLNAAKARMHAEQIRFSKTRVLAPDDGIVSARTAIVGSLTQPGQELFRLIRQSRLEWRAEVTATELGRLKPGIKANLLLADGTSIEGIVRIVAPTVDPQTRTGLVYVDLPVEQTGHAVRSGVYVRGEFELSRTPVTTLPQSAVLLRDGFSYVFRLEANNKVAQTKVVVGRRLDGRIAITSGLTPATRVVASGAGFLTDGDTVRVVAGGQL